MPGPIAIPVGIYYAALAGLALIGIGEATKIATRGSKKSGNTDYDVTEGTKSTTADDIDIKPKTPKPRTEEQIENDITIGGIKSKTRTEAIAMSGALARSTEECKSCPASTGEPKNEYRSFGNDINSKYQIYITKAPYGSGWVQEWTYATVSFDGFQRSYCLLQETKGSYDQFFIAENQIKKYWSGVQGVVQQAGTQNAIVSSTAPNKLAWYFMEKLSFNYFTKLFRSLGYTMDTYNIPMPSF
ncbi:Tox-REase-5 domain-containing protein [Xenorhabdus bovienii]|uniref:Tox-REase-5 domain-containing protein n=1 Tax=Xenorhabdus bovienii TaxID=40576 RepID=UPI0023B21D7E|nr:Tox-REase-5 domain-containing protein [Xenorhabdus bovienii]MDE9535990.1 restriction endonuclease fold toxin 5 domain-containing protein [Xenorhabdus bovienii]MDE9588945.1 restriction endonuclease fold toxin 5 domain-containing protein [Xenorhabdus bovienii]